MASGSMKAANKGDDTSAAEETLGFDEVTLRGEMKL